MYCTIALNFVETVLLMTILTRGQGPTDRPTDRQTDIATYRAAIAAKKQKQKTKKNFKNESYQSI